jgi:hypothetical protein
VRLSFKIDRLQESCLNFAALLQADEVRDHAAIANATGGSVTINEGRGLPDAPRTVEQVADYLGVTADTVRERYIPAWIEAGAMSPDDKGRGYWIIPAGFEPYRP